MPLVAALLLGGAAQAATPQEVTQFFRVLQMDDAQSVGRMISSGKIDPNTINPITGEPALIAALRDEASAVVRLLIAHPKLKLEQTAFNGNTALMMAAFKRNRQAVLDLLARGAIVTRPGWTALHYAAASGDDEITRILLDHHAYIDAEAPYKFTPLMIAAREGHESTAIVLMEAGADATLKNSEGMTAADVAARADKPRIVAAIKARLLARK